MPIESGLLLFLAGILAGCISALAGGSSIITFPMLLASGLPPITANATNFLTALSGNLGAARAYSKELGKHRSAAIRLGATSMLGGLVGCILLLNSSNEFFAELVPWLLLCATLSLAFGKRISSAASKRLSLEKQDTSATGPDIVLPGYVLIFAFSIYGGFFGAGLGVIMLAGLTIIGYSDYHEANALKNLTNAAIGVLGVMIYAVAGLVSWPHALILMAGSSIGGYAADRIYYPEPLSLWAFVFLPIIF